MLEKSIREFKWFIDDGGIIGSLGFVYSSLDQYLFSRVIRRLIYDKMNGYVIKKLNNSSIKMILNANDTGISQELMRIGSHEPLSTKILMKNLHEEMNVVDIGANLGYFALQEAEVIGPKGLVYAIEPIPQNYLLLKKNIALNGFRNVRVFNLAIGNADGCLDLFLSPASNWASAFKTSLNTNQKLSVPSERLDTFLEGRGRVDLIRMDVEGYETNIIDGMEKTLKQKHLMLFIEVHPLFTGKEKCKRFLQKLGDYGFAPLAVVFGNHPGKLIENINDMKSLMHNDHLMNAIFHGFFIK